MGVVQCTPVVHVRDNFEHAKLEWHNVDRYGSPAGEILAAFEVFLVIKSTWVCE